ncbi:MAG: hypothetical protein RLZZ341_1000, partial [Pseudomonadota bacterium]
PRDAIGPAAVSGGALAVGLSSAMVLALGAERLAFPLGYRWPALPLLLVVAFALSLGAAWSLIRRQSLPALAGAGLLMALASLAVQVGWLQAAGFRPGLIWNLPLAAGAAAAALVGYTAAMWLAYSDGSSNGARRTLWRLGAATLMVLTMVASQEVLITAAGLPVQIGSIFRGELSSTWLTLVAITVGTTATASATAAAPRAWNSTCPGPAGGGEGTGRCEGGPPGSLRSPPPEGAHAGPGNPDPACAGPQARSARHPLESG